MVFWRTADGDILESYRYAHWRGPINMTSRYGLGRSDAAPAVAVAVADDDQQYLFWRTSTGHIGEGHHTDHWTRYRFPSWGTATSAPADAVDPKTTISTYSGALLTATSTRRTTTALGTAARTSAPGGMQLRPRRWA
jgi:hypothetical protein